MSKTKKSDQDDDGWTALADSFTRALEELDQPGVRLIQAFIHYRKTGQPVPESVLAKLDEAFGKIAAGQSADLVLGLKRPRRGKPAAPNILMRNFMLAQRLHELRAQGRTVDDAVELLSIETGVGESTLLEIVKTHTVRVDATGTSVLMKPRNKPRKKPRSV